MHRVHKHEKQPGVKAGPREGELRILISWETPRWFPGSAGLWWHYWMNTHRWSRRRGHARILLPPWCWHGSGPRCDLSTARGRQVLRVAWLHGIVTDGGVRIRHSWFFFMYGVPTLPLFPLTQIPVHVGEAASWPVCPVPPLTVGSHVGYRDWGERLGSAAWPCNVC